MKKITVLIVDDNGDDQFMMDRELSQIKTVDFTLLHAYKIEEAEELYETHKRAINYIFMDGCLKGSTPDTLDLIRKIKADTDFEGKVIGTSSTYNEQLKEAGCDGLCDKKVAVYLKLKGVID